MASRIGIGLALGLLAAGPLLAQERVGLDDPRWRIDAADSRIETYRGRRALVLRNGKAWLDGVDLRDGAVEFDLAASAEQGFDGLVFRARDHDTYEHVYLRPHLSGKPDAVQYTPVFHGLSGWQIYSDPRFVLPAEIPVDQWVHVRIAFRGSRLEVTVGDRTLVFPDLVLPAEPGGIGLASSAAPGRFANLVVTPGEPSMSDAPGAEAPETPAGIVKVWRVSSPFAESRLESGGDPRKWDDLAWDRLAAGVRGIANLARVHGRSADANTVFAAVTLEADRATSLPVDFGFSDRVEVFLDGRPLYRGRDEYRSRDYRFLGTVGFYDTVILPLEPGRHELWFAVSEDFGGWAITARFPVDGAVRVLAP